MRVLILCVAALVGACASANVTPRAPASVAQGETYEAAVRNTEGRQIGVATFRQGRNDLVIRLELEPGSLTPGWHGAHIHEVGTCDDANAGFKASGSHAGHNKEGPTNHGLLFRDGPEAGDLPNIYAPAQGPIMAELVTTRASLDRVADMSGRVAALRDRDGSALIIHAGPDDHMSQPIGGAGARVACAVIQR